MRSGKRAMMLPDPETQPTVGAEEVAAAYGIGINAAYAQGRLYIDTNGTEGIPALRMGRSLRFPTAAVRAHLRLGSDSRPEYDGQQARGGVHGQ